MRLEYSRPETHGNFADDLNEWLWDAIAPGLVDNDPDSVVLGIGTVFSRWFTDTLPPSVPKIVVGSGGGKAGGPPVIDSSWHVYGVRGPLTAAYSGLPQSAILTDPAMLLRDLPQYSSKRSRRRIGFMPHIWSLDRWDWQAIAEELGLEFISPRADSKETIDRIIGLESLMTEAMHGAIVADAFRVPWMAISISPRFESSKWCDWGGSVGLQMAFHDVPDLRLTKGNFLRRTVRGASSVLSQLGLRKSSGRPPSSRADIANARDRLRWLMASGQFQLSDRDRLDEAISRTRGAIERVRQDAERGIFRT